MLLPLSPANRIFGGESREWGVLLSSGVRIRPSRIFNYCIARGCSAVSGVKEKEGRQGSTDLGVAVV